MGFEKPTKPTFGQLNKIFEKSNPNQKIVKCLTMLFSKSF
jgi:hypothetical protein